jgi:hypothetical protein
MEASVRRQERAQAARSALLVVVFVFSSLIGVSLAMERIVR